jgi:hypothetical protein
MTHKITLALSISLLPSYLSGAILSADQTSGRSLLLLSSTLSRPQYVIGKYLGCLFLGVGFGFLPAVAGILYAAEKCHSFLPGAAAVFVALLLCIIQTTAWVTLLSAMMSGWSNVFGQLVISILTGIYYVRETYTRFGPPSDHLRALEAIKIALIFPYPIVTRTAQFGWGAWKLLAFSASLSALFLGVAIVVFQSKELGTLRDEGT